MHNQSNHLKTTSFRIRGLSQKRSEHIIQEKQQIAGQYTARRQQAKLSSLFQSFENIITSLFSENAKKSEVDQKAFKYSTRAKEIDYRDRFVTIDLPEFLDDRIQLKKLESWIGQVCSESLSVAFHYFIKKKINYDQMKVFASQCLLRNIVVLIEKYKVTPEQMNFIDKTMNQKVFPYLKTKYPMTAEKEINKMFKDSVKSIDNSEILTNDYFYSSNVTFQYRESGRYDDVIMMLMNEIMRKVDGKIQREKNKKASSFVQFKSLMTQIFQKSFDEQWMNQEKIISNESKIQMTKNKAKDKYRQTVEQYTSYLIGRKISQNTETYTDQEIKSKSITIKSPAILRILMKWSEELWSKFENENYFMERTEGLGLIQSKKVGILLPQIKTLLTDKMKIEKSQIQQFLQNIEDINYKQQIQLLQNQLESQDCLYIEKYQRIAGKFACKIVNNIESFVIDYLNRLIHGLTKVSKICYSEMEKRPQCHLYWPSPFNLISFKLSDILRCKYASKEKEVLKVFSEIVRESNQNPDKFKVIRIKNRLKNATNDILINAKFNNTINCEIQIAVNALNSDFIECSNKINHYIYELERSRFGPILQMCSIWKTYEKRSQIFKKLIEKEQPRQQSHAQHGELLRGIQLVPEKNPFVCSECSKHYYHNNFIVSHLGCQEMSYWKCAKCLIAENYKKCNRDFFFKNHKELKDQFNFCQSRKEIPVNGACIYVNRSQMEVLLFRKIDYNFKTYLIHRKDKKVAIMREVTTKDQVKKFFNQCLVFELPQKTINCFLEYESDTFDKQIITKLFIPDYLNKCLKQQKQTISIVREDYLSQVNVEKILQSNRQKLKCVKTVEFSVTKLKNLNILSPEFVNLGKININVNDIADVSGICHFRKLQTFYFKQNHVQQLPELIGDLKQLRQIDAYDNKISSLPESFSTLNALVSLNLSKNQFLQFPDKLDKLENLREFYGSSNQLTEFPQFLKRLKNLQVLNLDSNQIPQMPEEIPIYLTLKELSICDNNLLKLPSKMEKMTNLHILQLQANQIQSIPLTITRLNYLEVLNFKKNRLAMIPDEFVNLKQLYQLNLTQNSFQTINPCIFKLSELKQLYLAHNKITAIDNQFDKLPKLTKLTLNDNKLKKFPSTIHFLTLKEFSFDGNPCDEISLDDYPNLTCQTLSVSFLTNLKTITCSKILPYKDDIKQVIFNQNKLEKVPNVLFEFKNLEEVELRSNRITLIPDKFRDQDKIIKFEISSNSLINLPSSFASLKALEVLDLTSNNFSQIPQVISKLQNLKQLKMGQNKLKELPQALKNLTRLAWLQIDNNQFESIPHCVGQLNSLLDFYAQSNKIKEIPIFICMKESIQRMNLESNEIEKIPKEISRMKGLEDQELNIWGNPIKVVEDEEFVAKKALDWMEISLLVSGIGYKHDGTNFSHSRMDDSY